jgi:GT2 family glycosyltransferase
MNVSVVILNWNGKSLLRDYLPNVVRHTLGDAGVELVVADNGSEDGSLAFLEAEYPQIRRIDLGHNHGFAEGYNLALAQVDARYAVLLNSDVEVTPGWLNPLVDYMDAHPDVAACQPKIRSLREPEYFEHAGASGGYMDFLGYPFCRGRLLSAVEKDTGQYDEPADLFWATGACLFVRTDTATWGGWMHAFLPTWKKSTCAGGGEAGVNALSACPTARSIIWEAPP